MNNIIFKNMFYKVERYKNRVEELNDKQKYLLIEIFYYCEKFVKSQKSLLTYNIK